jgi:UDP-N-acetylmuramate dehydrogenase
VQLKQLLSTAFKQGILEGQVKFNESLSGYTTWKIGGKAECVFRPARVEDLQTILKLMPENIRVFWIGLGSNLLVRDGGLKGLVINTNGVINQCEFKPQDSNDNMLVKAQAGLSCALFSRKVANKGLNGAEYLSGIPGTIGGALAMNAGAFGGETWDAVTEVEMITRYGNVVKRQPEEFEIAYRSVKKNDNEWFLSGTFCYPRDPDGLFESKQKIKTLLAKRAASQPTRLANAGSVFKNPQHDFAARLIEACHLKGTEMGGARISEKHANYIINTGDATARDVEELIVLIKDKVDKKFNIRLQTEIKIIGNNKKN